MRYLLPKVEYRRVKDRKAARDLRREKSLQMVQLIRINKALRKENEKLNMLFRERQQSRLELRAPPVNQDMETLSDRKNYHTNLS